MSLLTRVPAIMPLKCVLEQGVTVTIHYGGEGLDVTTGGSRYTPAQFREARHEPTVKEEEEDVVLREPPQTVDTNAAIPANALTPVTPRVVDVVLPESPSPSVTPTTSIIPPSPGVQAVTLPILDSSASRSSVVKFVSPPTIPLSVWECIRLGAWSDLCSYQNMCYDKNYWYLIREDVNPKLPLSELASVYPKNDFKTGIVYPQNKVPPPSNTFFPYQGGGACVCVRECVCISRQCVIVTVFVNHRVRVCRRAR